MEWHRIAYFVPMVLLRTYSLTLTFPISIVVVVVVVWAQCSNGMFVVSINQT